MHTGSFTFARPSIGSWVSYGLGTVNRNLPSFVVLAPHSPYAGAQVWGSDFLPGSHQGTLVVPGAEPVANLQRRTPTSRLAGAGTRALAQHSTERHLAARARRPAARRPHQVVRDGLRHAGRDARGVRPVAGDRRDARALRPAARQHAGLRLAVPGRPPAGRARRAVRRADRHRLVEQLGRARRHADARAAGQERRPADRRAAAAT